MKTLRGAIVGYGNVAADAHRPGFAATPGFEIVAAVDRSEARRTAARAAMPGAGVYADLDALVASGTKLDFIDVATPPDAHLPISLAALARGWHVLCEKPLATDRQAVTQLATAARRARKTLFTVHNWKSAPIFQRLRGLVASGTAGEPRDFEWRIERPNPPLGATASGTNWRLDKAVAGGGILVDHGWHAFYLIPFLLGRAPRSIVADVRTSNAAEIPVDDTVLATLDFGDCQARIFLTWAAPARRTWGLLRGSGGEIEIIDDALAVRRTGRAEEWIRFSPPVAASSYHPEWFPALLADFRGEVAHLGERYRNLAEAERCAEVIAGAYASNGSVIPVGAAPLDVEPLLDDLE